jgi:hypothetical protein
LKTRALRRCLAAVTALGLVAGAAVTASATTSRATPRYQYGLSTYVTYNCQGEKAFDQWASTEIAQYKSLGANTIALAFPLYTSSLTSNRVAARLICGNPNYQSPPPGLLASIVQLAHAAGLQVFVRPLIDQEVLFRQSSKDWRGILSPTKVSVWFRNYVAAIKPYLVMAQANHVEHVAIETELNSIADAPNWTSAIAAARAAYKGDLAFNYSWNTPTKKAWRPYTSLGIDTYPIVTDVSISQTPAQLLGQWNHLLHTNPDYVVPLLSRVTIDEIGIPAQQGAYGKPFAGALPLASHPFNQSVQLRWFTAACAFMKQHQMRGIYYFGPWMGTNRGSMLTSPSPARPSDIQPASRTAIKRCFS